MSSPKHSTEQIIRKLATWGEAVEALVVPSDDRLRLDDDERRTPTRPDP